MSYRVMLAGVQATSFETDDWLSSLGLQRVFDAWRYAWIDGALGCEDMDADECVRTDDAEMKAWNAVVQWQDPDGDLWFDFGVVRIASIDYAILTFSYRRIEAWTAFLAPRSLTLAEFVVALSGVMGAKSVAVTNDVDGIGLVEVDESFRNPGHPLAFPGLRLVCGSLLPSVQDIERFELRSIRGISAACCWPFDAPSATALAGQP